MVVVAAFHDFLTIGVVLWWWAVALGTLEAMARTEQDAWEVSSVDTGTLKVIRGSVLAFIVLWAVVQPAWARWIWHTKPPTVEVIDRTWAAERWFDAPLEWRVRTILEEGAISWELAGEGLTRARQAVRVHPGASRLWLLLGQLQVRIYNELGRWPVSVEGARTAFARATQLEPHQPWPWLEWARLERNLGNLNGAAELARRAVVEEPSAVRALLFLARLELDLGSVESARQAYSAAVAAAEMRRRSGLSAYERELLSAPPWQFREIAEALP
jgi:tetratricopeptide (TPR) repeat protein